MNAMLERIAAVIDFDWAERIDNELVDSLSYEYDNVRWAFEELIKDDSVDVGSLTAFVLNYLQSKVSNDEAMNWARWKYLDNVLKCELKA